MAKYAIGIDFGTESGRAVLVDVATGEEVATAVHKYADGVLDERLPGGAKLDDDWALQNPADYIAVLRHTIPAFLRDARVGATDVIGVGTDFTACTMMPIDGSGTPLCLKDEWRSNPHAWVKLWKHHAAQPEADRINEVARRRNEPFLARYGGKISSEWFFSKVLEILDESPEIYAAADRFIEGADWIVMELTGVETRNSCTAGYKAMWDKQEGFPPDDYFKALDPRLEHVIDEKMSRTILPLGAKAGEVTKRAASLTGLAPGTAVCVGNVDAHVAVPAVTVVEPGRMVAIMGTSVCHMVLGTEKRMVEGMCGVVEDGMVPGYFGYEAGQSAVGDIFAWFVDNCVPGEYRDEAKSRGLDIHGLLEEKARAIAPGGTGLLALDWWNGNRSILVDHDLTGVLIGANLGTKPEEIYRALVEATAFGTRMIIETFAANGVAVREIITCGGLPDKNKLLMQIFSDVTGREMKVGRSAQATALGSAMHASVAAGKARGGYDSIVEAAAAVAGLKDEVYRPDPNAHALYTALFEEYKKLHDYFGRYQNPVLKRLKEIRARTLAAP
jgi:L-ribulokinase